jgi:hypothetical protein
MCCVLLLFVCLMLTPVRPPFNILFLLGFLVAAIAASRLQVVGRQRVEEGVHLKN